MKTVRRPLRIRVMTALPLAAALLVAPAFAASRNDDDAAPAKPHPPSHASPPPQAAPPPPPPSHAAPPPPTSSSSSHSASPVSSHPSSAVESPPPSRYVHESSAVEPSRPSGDVHHATPVESSRPSSSGYTHATTVMESVDTSEPGYVTEERETVYTFVGPPAGEVEASNPETVEAPPPNDLPASLVDLGFSTGVNNPGGAAGGELEVHLGRHFSLGAAAGIAPWGMRLTPQLRVYPGGFNHPIAFFFEGGYSYNPGGVAQVDGEHASQVIRLGNASTANAAIGLRFQTVEHLFLALRAGWQFPIEAARFSSTDGSPVESSVATEVRTLMQPGGFTAGAALGFTL